MFYVVPEGTRVDGPSSNGFDTLDEAQAFANERRTYWAKRDQSRHYDIMKVEWVWATKTLADRSKQVKS